MKRINVHLLVTQVTQLKKIAKAKGLSFAELIRKVLSFYLSFFESGGPMADLEFVRLKMVEKRDGDDVEYEEVVRALAQEKATEYRNKQHNSARITTVVEHMAIVIERMESLENTEAASNERLSAMEAMLNELHEANLAVLAEIRAWTEKQSD